MMSILMLTKENKGMQLSHVSHPRLGVGSLSTIANRMECFADSTVSSKKTRRMSQIRLLSQLVNTWGCIRASRRLPGR